MQRAPHVLVDMMMWSDSGGDVEAGYEPVVFFDASPHVVVSFDLFDLT